MYTYYRMLLLFGPDTFDGVTAGDFQGLPDDWHESDGYGCQNCRGYEIPREGDAVIERL